MISNWTPDVNSTEPMHLKQNDAAAQKFLLKNIMELRVQEDTEYERFMLEEN